MSRGFKLSVLLTVVAILGGVAAAEAAPGKLANPNAGPAGIEWRPVATEMGLVLTVSGPQGFYLRQEYGPGQAASFSVFDSAGAVRPAGSYVWELRAVPQIDEATRADLQAARESGTEPSVLGKAGRRALEAQSGAFAIADGAIVMGGESEPRPGKPAGSGGPQLATKDQVIPDDLIVQGSICAGLDCVNNENFGFDTIRMKENNTRIDFTDTSTTSGFPTQDWEIAANDSASGGRNALIVSDENNQIFVIESGNVSNALYVDDAGRVGLRTANPVLDLHIATSNTPGIRLEQTSAGGFTAQTWDIAGNEANFFVRDVTGGSLLPFRIRPGAPTSSIDISASGNVGVGTASPTSRLDLVGGQVEIGGHSIGERSGTIEDLQVNALRNTIYNIDSDNNSTNASFSVSRDGDVNAVVLVAREDGLVGINRQTPSFPVHVGTDATNGNGAHVTAAGIWTDGSSRVNKTGIRGLELDDAMVAFRALEPVRYRGVNSPDDEEYLGFIAEDVPELVAMNSRQGLSPMDIIALVTKVSQEQQRVVDEQSEVIRQLLDRVAELEDSIRVRVESR